MRTYAPGMLASAGHTGLPPCNLLDIQTVNGDFFYWADREISAPAVLTADGSTPLTAYAPWIVGVPNITLYRSLQTDTGSFTPQNVSGDSLQRDLEALLRRTTLEGAQFCYRMWSAGAGAAWRTWYGTLSLNNTAVADAQLNARDIFDPSALDALDEQYTETCQWLWGTPRCGVTPVPPGTDITPDVVPASGSSGGSSEVVSGDPPVVPNYVPVPGPGDPGGGGPGNGGTGGGSPGNPGNPGNPSPGSTVTSSTECMYSYQTCQVVERFCGVVNHYEKNYGEALVTLTGVQMNRARKF